jgi:hypothetical protein
MKLMPSLVHPYLEYLSKTLGKKIPECAGFKTTCEKGEAACSRRTSKFLGLYCDRKYVLAILDNGD